MNIFQCAKCKYRFLEHEKVLMENGDDWCKKCVTRAQKIPGSLRTHVAALGERYRLYQRS